MVFDKANLCSSSVLDRLNPLFEPGMCQQVVWDICVCCLLLRFHRTSSRFHDLVRVRVRATVECDLHLKRCT